MHPSARQRADPGRHLHTDSKLVPVHHRPHRQGMGLERGFNRLQIELRRQVHDGQIFVVERPVRRRRVAAASGRASDQPASGNADLLPRHGA